MKARRPPESYDIDRTDTLPALALDVDETGTLAVPQLPHREIPAQGPEPDDRFSATDTFAPAVLGTPMAAIPVSAPDLAESLREREGRLAEAMRREQELEGQLAQAGRRVHELDAELEQSDRHCTELEAQLAEVASQCAALERELVAQREAQRPAIAAPLPLPVAETPGLAEELGALRRTNGMLYESISSLHGRLGLQEAMLADAEEALRGRDPVRTSAAVEPSQVQIAQDSAAPELPESSRRVDWAERFAELEKILEAERVAWAGKLGEQALRLAGLQAELEARRTTPAAPGDAPIARAPADVPVPAAAAEPVAAFELGPEAPAALRVLVRLEKGNESVHPLGRHTTIGRTPDNDIQVNTTYVSRHHAVLLAGGDECILEDLNSTNGVLVNGHRVGRQVLQHGDMVVVGKTQFRYETRP